MSAPAKFKKGDRVRHVVLERKQYGRVVFLWRDEGKWLYRVDNGSDPQLDGYSFTALEDELETAGFAVGQKVIDRYCGCSGVVTKADLLQTRYRVQYDAGALCEGTHLIAECYLRAVEGRG